ncbi:uncharacterized PE-PGRS family protein PE_PGRS46-like [Gigantopelta aegis]|uniref:uncharacterized PE-PGRS family protein PE_PGRS46-like n=1 Tax=Gigantopelta aegis TaxID=1735272 RepID=UPI001B88AD0D|nr:uncharacterized PE-PGRS family protein PE_PGRS46-like [Gigantopelta aegis]
MSRIVLCLVFSTLTSGVFGQSGTAASEKTATNPKFGGGQTSVARQPMPSSGSGMSGLGMLGLASGSDLMRDMATMSMMTNRGQPQSAPVAQRSGGGGMGGLGSGAMGALALTGGLGDSFRELAGLSMMTKPGMASSPLGMMAAGSVLDLGFGMGDNMLENMLLFGGLGKSQSSSNQPGGRGGGGGGALGMRQSSSQSIMPWLFMDGW